MDKTYLLFGHRGARYALDARAVRESVWLPELSIIEELPHYIVGGFNLRGRIVPVLDLDLCFGHPRQGYRPSDCVIVIETEATRIGIGANELHEVVTIPESAIEDVQDYQDGLGVRAQFICGVAKLDEGLVMLLDVAALLNCAPPEEAMILAEPGQAPDEPAAALAQASAEAAQIFRERAKSLAQVTQPEEHTGLAAYAVIGLGGELFGLPVNVVREFAHIRSVVPVPCCPPHIVGNMNLRGDILTLVDIRPALGMPVEGKMAEVVVLRVDELLLGVQAAEIVDVVTLGQADIAAVPVASDGEGKAYCKGVATIGGRAISLLDLHKILTQGELQVKEEA